MICRLRGIPGSSSAAAAAAAAAAAGDGDGDGAAGVPSCVLLVQQQLCLDLMPNSEFCCSKFGTCFLSSGVAADFAENSSLPFLVLLFGSLYPV